MNVRSRKKKVVKYGAIALIVAVALPLIAAMLGLAIDIGWIHTVRNQLQVAADSGALAAAGVLYSGADNAREAAKRFVGENPAGWPAERAEAMDEDVEVGWWDADQGTFSPSGSDGNAVRVTVRKQLDLIIGPLLGVPHSNLQASAVALMSPRDIAFVIDLSASMNNDTEIWSTEAINNAYPDFPGIGSDLMDAVFEDFGFGSSPGVLQHIAEGLPGAPNNNTSYSWLANVYLMNNNSVPAKYRVQSSDNANTRKTKAYSWLIDYQLAQIMPEAIPVPDSNSNLAYWSRYLDYVVERWNNLPPNQYSFRIDNGGNPYGSAWPGLPKSAITQYRNKVGYLTYVQFMMDHGRERRPVGSMYTPLSQFSPDCPWFQDTDPDSPGYGYWFPPREQPTHAVRLAIMAAIDRIAELNAGLAEGQKDHISIITFDTSSGSQVAHPLNVSGCDYEAVKDSVRTLQAAAGGPASTASEHGLILAQNHLNPEVNPGGARMGASKLVIFISDGIPNLRQSSNTVIDSFASENSDEEWFTSGSYRYERNAVLMQIARMRAMGWRTFAVGVGLGTDIELMDRAARSAHTGIKNPSDPEGPRISPFAEGNPADYQDRMASIFENIAGAPFIRLAQ